MRTNQCAFRWDTPVRVLSKDVTTHECIRYKDHEGMHICYCGADKKAEKKATKDIV